MVVAVDVPAVCRSHNAYASRLIAQRMADVHPTYAVFGCVKCDEGLPFLPFRCPADPTHWHTGHDRFAPEGIQEVAVTTLPTAQPSPPPPLRRSIKLSADQCREIVRLYHVEHLNPRVIATRFDVVPQTVHEVAKGRTYLWATREMLATLDIVVPPSTTKHKPKQEESTVQVTQPPTILGDLDTVSKEERTLQAIGSKRLVTDMADALDMLLTQRDTTTLPRFVVTAIRGLVAQARTA